METNPVLAYGAWLAEDARRLARRGLGGGAPRLHRHRRRHHPRRGRAGHPQGLRRRSRTGARAPPPRSARARASPRPGRPWSTAPPPTRSTSTTISIPPRPTPPPSSPPPSSRSPSRRARRAAQCLDAYVAGLQILGRVGQGVNPAHRNRGWHATATVGAIGAAAACARLLGLDAQAGRLCRLDRDQHGGAAS